jgi:hypothetical protein
MIVTGKSDVGWVVGWKPDIGMKPKGRSEEVVRTERMMEGV